jgi:hypothetical protein
MSVVFGNSDGQVWGLVQRAMRDAGFRSIPVHVAILEKGQRSVKGLNSGSEGVVTVDLIVTLQKPRNASEAEEERELKQAVRPHRITLLQWRTHPARIGAKVNLTKCPVTLQQPGSANGSKKKRSAYPVLPPPRP